MGAGISGLALSHFLEERGVEHLVFEASDRCGGVIRSRRVDGRLVEDGPQRLRLTPALAGLVQTLGLEDRLVRVPPGHPLFVYRDGRLRRVPFTAGELVRTDLLSLPAKLRLFGEPFTPSGDPDESVGALLTRKLGREAYEGAAGPLFGGLFGSDPHQMPARHSLPTLLGPGRNGSLMWRFLRVGLRRARAVPAVSFREGVEELVLGLARRIGGRLHLETPVQALEPLGPPNGGWIARTGGDDPREFHLREVVLTTPAAAAARMLYRGAGDGEMDSDALSAVAQRLQTLRYNDLVLVHLHAECGVHGLGYQVAFGEPLRTRGVTFNASALGRKGVLTAFLGGARDPAIMTLDDEESGEIARTELRTVTGCESRPFSVVRTRMPAWDRSWSALDGMALPPGLHLCASYESRPGIPGRIARAKAMAERLAV